MLTTQGFRDIVHIGRHQRPQHYSIMQDIPWQARPFVKRRHRKVVTRADRAADGRGARAAGRGRGARRGRAQLQRGGRRVRRRLLPLLATSTRSTSGARAEIVAEEMPGAFVTSSADIFPQFREFERFTTACMNAFVGPSTGRYLERLAGALARRGRARRAARDDVERRRRDAPRRRAQKPVTLLLSGPAAGVLGGLWAGELDGPQALITFDVGGTSADIGIVTRARHQRGLRARHVGRRLPAARADDRHPHDRRRRRLDRLRRRGRRLPRRAAQRRRRARARPCYGRGGNEPTLTDANVVLGRIDPDRFLGGEMQLDRDARGRGRRAARATSSGCPARGGRGHRHDRQRQHGGRDPLAHGPEGPRSARVRARRLRRRRPAAGGRGRRLARHPRGARAAVPRDHLRDGPPDERPQVRPDAHRVHDRGRDRPRAARPRPRGPRRRAARAPARRRRRATSDDRGRSTALDCRYVGQGYELRVPLPAGASTTEALEEFHRLHEQEYGHAFRDPIEIVNLRVTAIGRRRRSSACRRADGGWTTPLLGEGESVFRRTAACLAADAPLRARAAAGRRADRPGPAIVFQRDTTVVVPPGWSASRPDASRQPYPDADEHRRRPPASTRSRPRSSRARSTRSRSRWATSSPACPTRRSSASPRTSAASICDAEARQLCESSPVDAAPVGPDPRLRARHQPALRGARRGVAARATSSSTTTRYYGASHEPDVGFVVPIFHGGELVAFSAHDRAPPRPRRADAGLLRHRRRDRRLRRGAAVQRDQDRGGGPAQRVDLALPARQHPRRALVVGDMEAQVAACRIGAERFVELLERLRLETVEAASEDLMDYSERMLRHEIEKLPDGTYAAEGFIDGFHDDPDPANRDLRIKVDGDRRRAPTSTSTSRARRRRSTCRSTCRSRARSTSRST